MPGAERLHARTVQSAMATAALLAVAAVVLAAVGVPAFATSEGTATRDLRLETLPLSILGALFAAAEAWAVHRGALRLAWLPALGLVAFAVGVYPSAGHLVAPLVSVNLLALATLHGLDRWLVRA